MAHIHSIYDTDPHFKIDPVKRKILNQSGKVVLVQGDHNSERFTFELDRIIDGHDMSTCNVVQVHFVNTDAASPITTSADVYDVDDLQVSPNGDDVVICSWLVSGKATKYVGKLSFNIRFVCTKDGDKIDYAWNTSNFSDITVTAGIYNGEEVKNDPQYDVLAQLAAKVDTADEDADEALEKSTEALEKANRASDLVDGCEEATNTLVLTHEQFVKGGYVEAIKEMHAGGKLLFWIGTEDEYEQDKDNLPANTFCITTDGVASGDFIPAEIPNMGVFENEADFETAIFTELEDMDALETKRRAFLVKNMSGVDTRTHSWLCSIHHISDGYAIVMAESCYGGGVTRITKALTNNVWQPFEWENPPMYDGVEYRTTKRHKGKNVYTIGKTVDVTSGEAVVDLIERDWSIEVIALNGSVYTQNGSGVRYDTLSVVNAHLFDERAGDHDGTVMLKVTSSNDQAYEVKATVIVEYTK